MQSTVKLSKTQALVIKPFHGSVMVEAKGDCGLLASPIFLDANKVGALIFALEQAQEVNEVAMSRMAA